MWQDLPYAIRNLSATPLLLCAAVLSLALGIGANTAVFTFTHAILPRPLPVKALEELALFAIDNAGNDGNVHGYSRYSFSYPFYRDVHEAHLVFSGGACRGSAALNLGHAGRSERVLAELVSGSYFEVLGMSPAAGQLLTSAFDHPSSHSRSPGRARRFCTCAPRATPSRWLSSCARR